MSGYSIGGYAVALIQRTKKSILCEGPTDKKVLDRLILERHLKGSLSNDCYVDSVDAIINDNRLSKMGARQKIELIAAELKRLSTHFNWLVDREWDGIQLDDISSSKFEPQILDWGAKTRGHSIENYWFCESLALRFLKKNYAGSLPPKYFIDIAARFESMLRLATAFSLVAFEGKAIGRCSTLVSAGDIQWNAPGYSLLPSYDQQLRKRGVDIDFAEQVQKKLTRKDLQTVDASVLRWTSHGHLGEQVLRSCFAHLAQEHGAPQQLINDIERGRQGEKLLNDSDGMSQWSDDEIAPLGRLLTWVG